MLIAAKCCLIIFVEDNTNAVHHYPFACGSHHGFSVSPSGEVYVTDAAKNRIFKFSNVGVSLPFTMTDPDGISLSPVLNNPTGVAVDADGSVYVSDTYNGAWLRVLKLNSSGEILKVWGEDPPIDRTTRLAAQSRRGRALVSLGHCL